MPDNIQTFDVVVLGGGATGSAVLRDAAGRGLTVALVDNGDIGRAQLFAYVETVVRASLGWGPGSSLDARRRLVEAQKLLRIAPHLLGPWRHLETEFLKPGRWRRRQEVPKVIDALGDYLSGMRLTAATLQDAVDRGATQFLKHTVQSCERSKQVWDLLLSSVNGGQNLHIRAHVVIDTNDTLLNLRTDTVEAAPNAAPQATATIGLLPCDQTTERMVDTSDPAAIRLVDPVAPGVVLVALLRPSNMLPLRNSPDRESLLSDCYQQLTTKNAAPFWLTEHGHVTDFLSPQAVSAPDFKLRLNSQSGRMPLIRLQNSAAGLARFAAEAAVAELAPYVSMIGKRWTGFAPLPGGDFQHAIGAELLGDIESRYTDLPKDLILRLFSAYGTGAASILDQSTDSQDLDQGLGAGALAAEMRWIIAKEGATAPQDILWFRSVLGASLSQAQYGSLRDFIAQNRPMTSLRTS